jgi:hypothetical protein
VIVTLAAMASAFGSVNVVSAEMPLPLEQVAAFDSLPAELNSEVRPLGASGEKYVTGRSWRTGCPVALTDLRVVMVRYINFEGSGSQGPLIVHRKHAKNVAKVMETMYLNQFQIAQIRPVDEFEADDDLSTLANNTSAFNCRKAYGTGPNMLSVRPLISTRYKTPTFGPTAPFSIPRPLVTSNVSQCRGSS